ncbi:hypothetical protein LTR95_017928 [Oleoguttula sp. CCFEE 5521]
MPPKKAKKAITATPARASRSSVPATVTTTSGKEIETTAALARPRRAATTATATTTPAVKTKKPAAKATAKAATVTPAVTKKRGRPAKAEDDEAEPPKKRGRPAGKSAAVKSTTKKAATGRKAKALEPEEAPDAFDTPAPRKRHSGPKGGETTKISTDDGAAADQLEEELIETAEPVTKRKAPAAKKGKGKATAALTSGKQYWLMKAEQIDREETLKSGRVFNSKFTIDDLKNRTAPEPWDGVRNLVARNNMRAMSMGDLAFFYASQGKGKLQPGITGIMEVVKEAEPDQSVYDEDHYGYVEPEKRKAENQWSLVHVEYRKKLSYPVTLKVLQKYGKTEGGVLSEMEVLKTTRLSVTKVTEKEWDFIVNEIVGDDYEEEAAAIAGAAGGDELPAITTTEAPTAGAVAVDPPVVKAVSRQPSRAASLQPSLALPVVQSTEAVITDAIDSAFPTSDLAKPASRAGSLQPASRAGSVKPSSRAGSVKPASRAGSLAPAVRASSRGRSRTPKPAVVEEAAVEQHEQLNSIMEEDGL